MNPTVLLTFDDTTRNQSTFVAPLLKKLGFHATFFITFFDADWRRLHADTLMTPAMIAQLDRDGFEIGNHTVNHNDLCKATPDELLREIDGIEVFCRQNRISQPVSFAYPGGPFCQAAADEVARRGYLASRSIGDRPYRPGADDPLNLPAYPVADAQPEHFEQAVKDLNDDNPVVLCYHGVPDRVHPWVNTEPENFERQMRLLKERNCRVWSLRDYFCRFSR